jgi:asparagine synthase (glutamine-hydrolysing)
MCGIAGISAQNPGPHLMTAALKMAQALAHRGPDSCGVKDLGPCVLANTRLAILDLSERGRQPMCNEDGTVWIAYNGECYNAAEHRKSLLSRGHAFRSHTDTEVILHLYEELGAACASELRGMFAFAIWDARAGKLVLGRDRLGIKPLYYFLSDAGIVFASEIKALLATGMVPRKLERAGVQALLQLGHIPPPWTAIHGVKPLPPGSVGVWERGSFSTSVYWSLPNSNGHSAPKSEPDAAEALGEILREAIPAQLMSDVPIALFLSGGVDSAAVGALTQSANASQLTALTIAFEEEDFDESESSKSTARLLGIPHDVIPVSAAKMIDSIDHAIWAMDQPTVDGLNSYWIARAAAEAGFKVALSGQGGDELFGGYESALWFERFFGVAYGLRIFPQSLGSAIMDHEQLPFRWRKLSCLFGADDPFVAAQVAVRTLFLQSHTNKLLNPSLVADEPVSDSTGLIAEWAKLTEKQDLKERIAYLDFPLHLESRLLRDSDLMSMAHSLELRPVLLDHQIVEFVLRLPTHLRAQKKRLFLDAIRGCMPTALYSQLLVRPKRTFTFPFARWIGGELRSTIDDVFRPQRLASRGVLESEAVQRLWQRYLTDPRAVGWSRLWIIFILARWCELMEVTA